MSIPSAGSSDPFVGSGVPLKGVGPEHLREGAVQAQHIPNGTITSAHILDGTIQLADLAAALQAFLLPTGSLIMWPGAAAPTEWFLCDGASKSRTTEAALFAVCGTAYGSVDGASFNLPDLRQRFPLGKTAAGTGATLGAVGGTIDHVHNLDTASSHAKVSFLTSAPHGRMLRKTVASWTETVNVTATSGATGSTATTLGAALGGDTDSDNPPFQVVNYIIKR